MIDLSLSTSPPPRGPRARGAFPRQPRGGGPGAPRAKVTHFFSSRPTLGVPHCGPQAVPQPLWATADGGDLSQASQLSRGFPGPRSRRAGHLGIMMVRDHWSPRCEVPHAHEASSLTKTTQAQRRHNAGTTQAGTTQAQRRHNAGTSCAAQRRRKTQAKKKKKK